jgi:two-component SAPR family response regulator
MNGLQILTLGQAVVQLNSCPVQWHSESARELFFYLLANHAGQSRDTILETLWGLEVSAINSNRFRVNVHRVRMALGARDTVLEEHGHYRLSPAVLAASDIHAFYTDLERAKHTSDLESRLQAFRRALAFYQGHFLAFEPFEQRDWVLQTRAELQAVFTRAQIEVSLLYCDQGNCQASVAALELALHVDPLLGENYHQKLMACLSVIKDQQAAAEHFRGFSDGLLEKINDLPMLETQTLMDFINQGGRVCQRQANITNLPPTHNCPFVSDQAHMDATASSDLEMKLEPVKTR